MLEKSEVAVFKFTSNTMNPKQRRYLDIFFILICIVSLSSLNHNVSAEICTVCSNETHIMNDETARVIWPPGNSQSSGFSCSEIGEKAVQGYFTNCEGIHNLTDNICSCGLQTPLFTCPLCGEGYELEDPKRVVAGKTCEEWEDHATNKASTADCPHYQTSLGAYCGCDISKPDYFDEFCRICTDRILPDYNKKVTFTDGRQKYCVSVEVEVNAYSSRFNCSEQQNKFNKPCSCGSDLIDIPTLNPTQKTNSAKRNIISTIFKGAQIASVILWFLSA